MFDRRRRLAAALIVLPVWTGALAWTAIGANPAAAASVTTPTSCTNTAQAGTTGLPITVAGAATPASVAAGDTVTLSDATFTINVPGAVLLAGYGLGLLSAGVNSIPADVTVTLLGSGTSEPSQASPPIAVTGTTTITDPTPANKTSGDESATPLSVTANVPTTTWTATGGDLGIRLGNSTTTAKVGPGGIIAVTFACTPGTPTPAGCGPAPAAACTGTNPVPAEPFTTVSVTGGSTTSSTTSSSTSSTSSSTTSSSTTSSSTTTSSTTSTSTTSTSLPSAPIKVTGTGNYTATCHNNVTPDASELAFSVKGTTISPVQAGSQVELFDQEWQVTVPASVLQTGINLGLLHAGDSLPGQVTASVFASNTKEGTRTSAPTDFNAGPIEVIDGAAQPLTTSFPIEAMSWTAVGGNVAFSMGETAMLIAVGPLEVVFTCGPKDPSVTIVEAAVIGMTDIPPAGRGTGSGTEVEGTAVEPAAEEALPKTGSNPIIPTALAIGLIDLGYLLISATRPARRKLRYLVQT